MRPPEGNHLSLSQNSDIMQYLEEQDVGRDVEVAKVPIVCGAVIFDLKCGASNIRPDKEMGYAACQSAGTGPVALGSVGAGTGATVGKLKGPEYAMKGGIGTCSYQLGELKVGALIVVNALGDIYDAGTHRIIAGALCDDKKHLAGTEHLMLGEYGCVTDLYASNTVIGVVATNAKLTKDEANKLASIAHDGLARAVRPAHTTFDGDTLFTMATGEVDEINFNVVSLMSLLNKTSSLEIKTICPLHGPIWRENIVCFIEKYQKWATWQPEEKGVVIAYASVYGHTENAADIVANALSERGVRNIVMSAETTIAVSTGTGR